MNTRNMTLEEIRKRGLDALARELGPAGMIRFLQQYEAGHGDYSIERHEWLPEHGVRAVAEQIAREREGGG